ncbi:MAG: 2-oxo acid dehydrogenase subunit E2 [Gammaproteobacteria bacterium]|nr:2-oxo acid dehydrogenase subunit E2 [Gammaproteobacteria bacterium]
MKIFKLPDLGEGLPDAEIHEWHVAVGDHVKRDQPLVSMETAKAVVEVPAPFDGVIAKLHGAVGDIIDTGQPLVSFEGAEEAPKEEPKKMAAKEGGATVAGNIIVGDTVLEESAMGITPTTAQDKLTLALPVVRLIAKKLKLDLNQIKASGTKGEVTLDDILHFLSSQMSPTHSTSIKAAVPAGYTPLKGVRRTMAQVMAISHQEVAAVTIVDDADIAAWTPGNDITARIVRAISYACHKEPALNGHFDGKSGSLHLSTAVHLGIAMDSGDGLFVPVIQNAQSLEKEAIRSLINRYKEEVRARTIPSADLQGATISLSNFGVFAGRYANPMIVPPMIAIVGCGKLREEIKLIAGTCEPHRIMPLSLTFDHRAATGGEGSRFLAAMMEDLQKAE